ncbi:protein orai-2-like [Zophobas morio]|uniref:protein orai-2-like n=1 Tax=Zophobas morio TaxID=2755281 RepID=UPI0030828946
MTESVIPQGVPHLQFLTSKLKNSATTSALFAGFAMIALVEVDIKGGEPQLLTIIFATLTSLLIFFHLIALLISTCLIPTAEGLESFIQPEHFSIPTNSMKETFIKLTRSYINTAWLFTTVLGTFFFMAEIIVLAWLKFYLVSLAACYAITAIIVPMMTFGRGQAS